MESAVTHMVNLAGRATSDFGVTVIKYLVSWLEFFWEAHLLTILLFVNQIGLLQNHFLSNR